MAESTRTQQLQALASQVPASNQQVAQGLQAAQDIQLKGQIKRAQPGAGPGAAQQLGAQQTQAGGQIALQKAAQTSQQLGQVGQLGLQQKGLETQQQLGAKTRELSSTQRGFQDRLSKLSGDLKDKLLDQQLEFKRDERGRLMMNDRQLADWAKLNAKSDEEYKNYAQSAQQVLDRKLQTMEQAYKLLTQQLDQQLRKGEAAKNNALTLKLTQQKQAMQKAILEEQAAQANKAGTWGAVGTVFGAGAGAVFGGPGGAVLGAQVGGGLGTTMSGIF